MNTDTIVHARHKIRCLRYKNKSLYVDDGITCFPLRKGEHDTHIINDRGGITIAIVKNDDQLRWGFAKCYKKDVYKRRIGKKTAIARANKTTAITTPDIDFKEVLVIAQKIANMIDNHGYHSTIDIIKDNLLDLKQKSEKL